MSGPLRFVVDGVLYEMSPDVYDEDGDELVCTMQPAPVGAALDVGVAGLAVV